MNQFFLNFKGKHPDGVGQDYIKNFNAEFANYTGTDIKNPEDDIEDQISLNGQTKLSVVYPS